MLDGTLRDYVVIFVYRFGVVFRVEKLGGVLRGVVRVCLILRERMRFIIFYRIGKNVYFVEDEEVEF